MVNAKFRKNIFKLLGEPENPTMNQNDLNYIVYYELKNRVKKHPYIWKMFFASRKRK